MRGGSTTTAEPNTAAHPDDLDNDTPLELPASTTRLYTIALIVPLLALVALAWNHYRFTLDDPYISFRYASNLIDGHGLVFNVGERVEGYSNFLWVLILAPFMKAGASPLLVAKLLGLGFAMLSVVVVYRAGVVLFAGERGYRVGLIAAGIVGFSSYYALWSIGALETALVGSLVIVSVYFYIRYTRQAQHGVMTTDWSWLPLALLGMTRPEGPIVFVVLLAAKAIGVRRHPERMRGVLVWATGFAVVYGLYFLWRWQYFGELLPNTYYAKVGGGHERQAGIEYVFDVFLTQGALYVVIALAALAGLLATIVRLRDEVLATLLALFVVYCAFVAYAGGDWMPGFRFVAQVYPLYALLLAGGLYEVVRLAGPRLAASIAKPEVVLLGSLTPVLILSSLLFSESHLKREVPWLRSQLGESIDLAPNVAYYRVARYLDDEATPGSWVALGEAGLIPYYANHVNVIDIYGLMDKHIARLPGALHSTGDAAYVLGRQPDYVLLFAAADADGVIRKATAPMQQFYDEPTFGRDYTLLERWPRALTGDLTDYFYLYARNSGGTQDGVSADLDLYERFDSARKNGAVARNDNPWGSSIAKFPLRGEGDAAGPVSQFALFTLPGASLDYALDLPAGSRPSFRAAIGSHPLSRTWGSDGFRMRVEVIDGTTTQLVANQAINATAGLIDLSVPLDAYAGKSVTLRLSIANDAGRNEDGDWPVWVNPVVRISAAP